LLTLKWQKIKYSFVSAAQQKRELDGQGMLFFNVVLQMSPTQDEAR